MPEGQSPSNPKGAITDKDEPLFDKKYGVVLNEEQRLALHHYFDPENVEGEPWPLDEPAFILVLNGELCINATWLHSEGHWATFPEKQTTQHLLDESHQLPSHLIEVWLTDPRFARFVSAAQAIMHIRPVDMIDGPYLNVRIDANVRKDERGNIASAKIDGVDTHGPRDYRLLVRATDPPLYHSDIKQIMDVAEQFSLEVAMTAAGLVITAEGDPPDED